MSELSTDLAAWEHEKRDYHGRWTKGGGLVEQLMADDMPWQFNIRTRGRTEPQKGDLAWMERPGRSKLVGRIIARFGDYAQIDADDGQRHTIDLLTGKTVQARPLDGKIVPRPDPPDVSGGIAEQALLHGAALKVSAGGRVLPDGTRVIRDPHPPNRAWPWLVIIPDGRESHITDKDEQRLFPRTPVQSPAGDVISPGVKQYLLPGMPESTTEYGSRSAPVQQLAKLLPDAKRALTPGQHDAGKVTWPEQGQQGAVAVVELPDGTKVITKSQDPTRNDREELSYYVSQVIGGGLPALARDPHSPRDLIEDYVEGRTAIRYANEESQPGGNWAGYEAGDVLDELMASSNVGDVGLLDYLTSNRDRHEGNVMVDKDGNATPIDMGMAEFDAGGTTSPYWPEDTDPWDSADVADIRRQLAVIQPEFTRLGRDHWYADMIYSLQQLSGDELPKDEYRALLEGARDLQPNLADVGRIAHEALEARLTETSNTDCCPDCGCPTDGLVVQLAGGH